MARHQQFRSDRAFTILFTSAAPGVVATIFRERLAGHLDYVESVLSGQPYLLGESFSVADCYLFTVLSWAESVEIDLSQWPSLAAYREDIRRRDSVREVMEWERREQ